MFNPSVLINCFGCKTALTEPTSIAHQIHRIKLSTNLYNYINDFFHKEDSQGAIDIFHDISSYINVHFEAEEKLLKQINYPHSEEHIRKHNELRHKFHAIQAKLNDYDVEAHHKIAIFLYNWLAKHILQADMEYKTYALSIK